jgi:hypothetical protein
MLNFIRKHWAALLIVIPLLPSIWRGFIHLFDWGARIDLVATKLHEVGGISSALAFLISPPPWLIWPALVLAMLLLLWDRWRQPKGPKEVSRSEPADGARQSSDSHVWVPVPSELGILKPRSMAGAEFVRNEEPLAAARILYDIKRREAVVLYKSSNIQKAIVEPDGYFITRFIFDADIGPFDVELENRATSLYETPSVFYLVLENEPHYVSLRFEPQISLSLLTQSIEIRLKLYRHRPSKSLSASGNLSQLRISLGTDRPFETVKDGLRTLRIKLENNTNTPVSNCSVHVKGLKPFKDYSDFLLKDDIRIPSQHHEFVDVLFYKETPPGKYIRFAIPLVGGFFAEAYDYATLPVQEHTFNLRAETLEGLSDEVPCRLWVDLSGRLRLESLTGPPQN